MLNRYSIATALTLACLTPALSPSWLGGLVQAQPRTHYAWLKQAVHQSARLRQSAREVPLWSQTNPYNQEESIARFADGSFRFSSDGGQNWVPVNAPAETDSARAAFALPANSSSEENTPATLFLYDHSLWRSNDQGQSFERIYEAPTGKAIRSVASLDALPGSALLQLDNGEVFTTLDTATATPSFGWTALALPLAGEISASSLQCAAREFCYVALTGANSTRLFRILPAINQFDELPLPAALAAAASHIALSVHPEHPDRLLLSSGPNLWSARDEDGQLAWSHEFAADEDIQSHGITLSTEADEFRVVTANNTYSSSSRSSCRFTFASARNVPAPAGSGSDDVRLSLSSARCSWTADAIGPEGFLTMSINRNGPFSRRISASGSKVIHLRYTANPSRKGGRINEIVAGGQRFAFRQDPQDVDLIVPKDVTIGRGDSIIRFRVGSNGGYRIDPPNNTQSVTANGVTLSGSAINGNSWAFGDAEITVSVRAGRQFSGTMWVNARNTRYPIQLKIR